MSKKVYLLVPLLLALAGGCFAQLRSASGVAATGGKPAGAAATTATQQALLSTLPFWDDFSYEGPLPAATHWLPTSTASVTEAIAILPPSLGVVTFDGVKPSGELYSNSNISGPADMLESDSLDLSLLSEEERASTYLSYFWQLQGLGERPDAYDYLSLSFLDDNNIWQEVWRQTGSNDVSSTTFEQELISLKDAGEMLGVNFFHPAFRFRFQSYNRLNGRFDNWHLDYVYLDKGRNAQDIYYNDQTVSRGFTSLLTPYTAMPIQQFFANPSRYLNTSVQNTFRNLQAPGEGGGETYRLEVSSSEGEAIATPEPGATILSGAAELSGQTAITMTLTNDWSEALLPYAERDSLYLIGKALIVSADEGAPYTSRNDQVEVLTVLHDYYAYDDGTAETAASLSGSGQQLAYQFNLEQPDLLTGIAFNFPFYKTSSAGKGILLKVWTRLAGINGGEEDVVVYAENVTLPSILPNGDGFVLFEFKNSVDLPAGIFYVGFEQVATGELPIGFDRTTDSRAQIFYNADGQEWKNNYQDTGSLLIRPYFDKVNPPPLGFDDIIFPPVSIYPNPTTDALWVTSEARALRLYNAQGQLVLEQEATASTLLDLQQFSPGMYLLQLQYKEGTQSKRILLVR